MGRIAPRRKRVAWDFQTLRLSCLRIWRRRTPDADEAAAAPLSQRLLSWPRTLWHLTDGYRWMEPLPYGHRRWIALTIVFLLLVLLWPSSTPTTTPTHQAPAVQNVPIQATLTDNGAVPTPSQPTPANDAPWKSYQIAAGQTLAQLFRDNNLPVGDVFAMAQVEGTDKPLSNLSVGQQVRLQFNAQGMVSALEIETSSNQVARFVRQADGSFLRTR